MTDELAATLEMLAQEAKCASDAWWVIGSAAVALHGANLTDVKDVDVMMSARDADAFLRRVRVDSRGAGPSERFQSTVFGIWKRPPIPVEIFGGFRLAVHGAWREVAFSAREAVQVGHATVYVPSAVELAALLHSFGRAKDLERAKLMRT